MDQEAVGQERWDGLRQRIERGHEHLESLRHKREAMEVLPRRERRRHEVELGRIDSDESRTCRALARLEGQMAEFPAPTDAARRELAVADQVLAQRRELAIVAARISPPAYIAKELGRGRAIR